MTRTNIDLDDDALADVMRRYGFHSKRDAVNFALDQARRRPMSRQSLLALRGVGWDGPSIDELRPPVEEFEISRERATEIEGLLANLPRS